MAKVLELPKLSPTMEEGQISAWHKKEGDQVDVDDLLAEVETDKATMEYRSFDKGTLLKILVSSGDVVKLGQPVAIIGNAGEDVSALLAQVGGGGGGGKAPAAAPEQKPAEAKAPEAKGQPELARGQAAEQAGGRGVTPGAPSTDVAVTAAPATALSAGGGKPQAQQAQQAPAAKAQAPQSQAELPHEPGGRVKASPYVRKLGREHGLDLSQIAGTGPGGRIVARDVETALHAPPSVVAPTAQTPIISPTQAPPPPAPAPVAPGLLEPEMRPLSMMRKAIARRLTESKQTVPHFYLTIDVDADPLHALREQINAELQAAAGKDQEATKLSFNDLIIKACAIALRRVPECNAQFTPEAILVHRRVDISVAVAVSEGLVTPVLRDADKKSLVQIATEVRELAGRARAKKLRPEEMANGTFSISNLGMYGIDEFSAVINPPEGAILAVGQVRREPVVKGEEIVPGRRLAMTLSCDHRVVDGAVGATFLKALRQLLERPMQILVG